MSITLRIEEWQEKVAVLYKEESNTKFQHPATIKLNIGRRYSLRAEVYASDIRRLDGVLINGEKLENLKFWNRESAGHSLLCFEGEYRVPTTLAVSKKGHRDLWKVSVRYGLSGDVIVTTHFDIQVKLYPPNDKGWGRQLLHVIYQFAPRTGDPTANGMPSYVENPEFNTFADAEAIIVEA
mmetsp:Transcript_20395/g.35062  ORF Transcript_20395/g.35062 Transcript_20395/m.35062 type:complete len:181 (-) Transcript_20395:58-600(-)